MKPSLCDRNIYLNREQLLPTHTLLPCVCSLLKRLLGCSLGCQGFYPIIAMHQRGCLVTVPRFCEVTPPLGEEVAQRLGGTVGRGFDAGQDLQCSP